MIGVKFSDDSVIIIMYCGCEAKKRDFSSHSSPRSALSVVIKEMLEDP